MKDLFSWRLRLSDTDFITLWESATFVFDTNFLLDLYRVSRSTSEDFLKILERLQDRIWLPYQVASEFLSRREEIIDSEAASFQKALSALDKWKDEQLNFHRLQGHLREAGRIVASEVQSLFNKQDAYISAINEVDKCFREKIEELTNTHCSLNSEEDYILERLFSLFDGNVGKPYDTTTLQKLYKEGEDRYRKEKPPGFKDTKKNERKYGDFILWKQTLDFAKAKSCSIILVTGEKKEDWWTKRGGQIVSPHLELRREFQEEVKQLFWMYQTQQFLEIAKEKLTIEIDPQSIEEANIVAEAEAAEEKAYEEVSQALQQIRTPLINEEMLQQLRTPLINEEMLRQIRTPLINEEMLRQIRIPLINEETLRQLRTPLINEETLRQLRTHLINERLSSSSDKVSNVIRNEEVETDSSVESFKKLDSQQNNDLVEHFNADTPSIEGEYEEEKEPKKHSESKKDSPK